jgi:beta-mannosidase
MGISTTRSVLLGVMWAAAGLADAATDSSALAFAQARDGSSVAAAIDLDGPWLFKATDETQWMDAVVPGVVQSDLLRVGRLKDPHYRDQELDAQWVERKEWEYRRRFRVGRGFLRHDRIILDCRGLDTIAEVYLNQRLVARTENMHRRHEFDVKPLLREGENEIRVVFRSILEWNRRRIEAEPKVLWCRGGELTDCRKGNLFFARKEGSDFGWDWGLRLLSSGIWRPIRLAAYDTARITDLLVRSDLKDPRRAVLNVSAEIERFRPRPLDIEIAVTLEGKPVASAKATLVGDQAAQALPVDDPRLWWPNGWGEHPLYEVTATLRNGSRIVHTQRLKIGLRTVEIARETDARGESFGIRVNGQLLFAKGANWIPADSLPDHLTEDHYRRLLEACLRANMNMIRLWGGGLYEADVLYEFCDENGLLIWHDFMFAVGPYIANEAYLESVRAEIKDVVRRLRHHPSIALWCGNNESESNMAGGQMWLQRYKTATWAEYEKIFHEAIPQTARQHDPDRPYWPSSPHHPLDRAKEKPDWETSSGNVHSYDVWGDGMPFSTFDKMGQYRFVAEFGYQALPDLQTIREMTAPEDRYFPSYVVEHHENSGNGKTNDLGTTRLARHLAALIGMPGGLDDWVYLSQVLQAEAVRRGVEALRRAHPRSTGALYWQLDDNWPVISWSSIDYHGRWKALHYLARRFFSPVLVSGVVEDSPDPIDLGLRGRVQIWGTSDRLQETPARLEWTLGRFDGTEVKRGEQDVTLPANRSTLLAELDFENEIGETPGRRTYRKESYQSRRQYYVAYRLVQGERDLSSNVSFFVPPKYLGLQPPDLRWTAREENDRWVVEVTAKRFAAFVHVGLHEGYALFSDNDFHLLPRETRRIEVLSAEVAEDQIASRLFARSLIDSRRGATGTKARPTQP